MSFPAGWMNRRQFLRQAAVTVAGLSAAGLAAPTLAYAQRQSGHSRDGRWTLAAGDFDLLATPGAPAIHRVSAVSLPKRLDFTFNALGAIWTPSQTQAPAWAIEFRASADGRAWTPWTPAPFLDQASARDDRQQGLVLTDVAGLAGRWAQVRLRPRTEVLANPGALPNRIDVTFIDSAAGPQPARTAAATGAFRAASAAPPLITRAAWGADESLRFNGEVEIWPPEFVPPRKVIVHHTVTQNNDSNPAATVRAIYHYHAVTLGWGDIGYHFLIDQQGNIYEGRSGGPSAVAGHALGFNRGAIGIGMLGNYQVAVVPGAAQSALLALIRQLTATFGIDPQGSGFFVNAIYANVMGHRDCNSTTCPGDTLYGLLSMLRGEAAAPPPADYRAEWLQHTVPGRLRAGRVVRPLVRVRNAGSDTWTRAEPYPYRTGYRWYADGAGKYNAEPDLEVHTSLPREVPPGQTVDITMTLRVPRARGRYLLQIDMVEELVTWFEDAGGTALWLEVDVV